MQQQNTTQQSRGFTIVELLIVIIVIAILAAITLVAFNGITQRARVSAATSAVEQAAKKVAVYAVTNADDYPASLADAGVTDNNSTTFQYSVNNGVSPKTYCITASVSEVSYFMSNTQQSPQSSGCPGHGQGGVAAVTNLATNPSFETGGANVEVRRNIIANPAPVVGGAPGNWVLNRPANGTLDVPSISGEVRYIATVASGLQEGIVPSEAGGSVAVGGYYAGSVEVKAAGTLIGRAATAMVYNNAVLAQLINFTWTGNWQKLDIPASTASTTTNMARIYVYIPSQQASDVAWIRKPIITQVPTANISAPAYFDGGFSPDSDLLPSWTGATGASASILTGKTVPTISATNAVTIQSSKWAKYGSKSVRIIPTGASGPSYAVLSIGANTGIRGTFLLSLHRDTAQPDRSAFNGVAYWNPVPQPQSTKWLGSGDNDIRVYGDPGPSGSTIILRHDGIVGDPDLYVDGFMQVVGNYTGQYHNGDSTDWIWNGAPNASTSTGPGR